MIKLVENVFFKTAFSCESVFPGPRMCQTDLYSRNASMKAGMRNKGDGEIFTFSNSDRMKIKNAIKTKNETGRHKV